MGKLKIKDEYKDEQQEKHEAYLKAGFKLNRTRKIKDGLVIRTYIR